MIEGKVSPISNDKGMGAYTQVGDRVSTGAGVQDVEILDSALPEDRSRWVSAWELTQHREPQAHPAYCMTVAADNERSLCAIQRQEQGTVMFPFQVRTVPWLDGHYRDAITPYGYGGPYTTGSPNAGTFWAGWESWAASTGTVGIVVRRHLFDTEVLPTPGVQFSPLRNVFVDMTRTPDELWTSFEGRVRTGVRKAIRSDVTVEIDPECARLDGFVEVYHDTMRRRGAEDYFLFSLDALEQMIAQMPKQVTLCHAFRGGRLIASEMQLLGRRNAYYFLAGATDEARKFCANQLVKWETIKWLHPLSLQRYVLGGGMTDGDSLFSYKRGYSPNGTLPFLIDYHESIPSVARELEQARVAQQSDWTPGEHFAPPYRWIGTEC